jgi:hypothetical protein
VYIFVLITAIYFTVISFHVLSACYFFQVYASCVRHVDDSGVRADLGGLCVKTVVGSCLGETDVDDRYNSGSNLRGICSVLVRRIPEGLADFVEVAVENYCGGSVTQFETIDEGAVITFDSAEGLRRSTKELLSLLIQLRVCFVYADV